MTNQLRVEDYTVNSLTAGFECTKQSPKSCQWYPTLDEPHSKNCGSKPKNEDAEPDSSTDAPNHEVGRELEDDICRKEHQESNGISCPYRISLASIIYLRRMCILPCVMAKSMFMPEMYAAEMLALSSNDNANTIAIIGIMRKSSFLTRACSSAADQSCASGKAWRPTFPAGTRSADLASLLCSSWLMEGALDDILTSIDGRR